MKTSAFIKTAISSILLLSLSSVQAAENEEADDFTANISGYIGHKTMDDNDWSTLDDQAAIGIIFDVKKQRWPVSIVLGLVGTADIDEEGSTKSEGYTSETRIGVRKTFDGDNSRIHRYIGGGVAMVSAEVKNINGGITTSKDDDNATGAWIGAGLYYDVTEHFNLGFDVTYTAADVTLFGVERKAGGMNSGITAGYHW